MLRSVTFELPPSPRCVIQKHVVVLSTEDAVYLVRDLLEKLNFYEEADAITSFIQTEMPSSDSPPSD